MAKKGGTNNVRTRRSVINVLDLDGVIKPLSTAAIAHGIAPGTFFRRVRVMCGEKMKNGELITITQEMVAPVRAMDSSPYIIDGIEYPHAYAAWKANKWVKSPDVLRRKCYSLGTKNVTKDQILERKQYLRENMEAKKEVKTIARTERIPAKWAGLSNYKNTGAGRGEIPDAEWIGMIGQRRSISAALCQLNLVQVQTSTI